MKTFIDEKGTFEIKVPVTWRYSLKEERVHTFQEYEIWKSDAFQLSIQHLDTEDKRNRFTALSSTLQIDTIEGNTFYKLPNSGDEKFTTRTWLKNYDGNLVAFTLTHPNNPDKDLDSRTLKDKIEIVHNILKEFKLIDAADSEKALNSYRFDMFLQGVGATALMLNKAIENKAFIEGTCVLATQIDALLRVGIILKTQINNNNSNIETEWVYQGLTDKKKSEKDIYKKALDLAIIDPQTFDDLYKLYDDRNRVIHRFIISEITLAEVEEISYKYYMKQQAITKLIYDLESEQIRLRVGMSQMGAEKTDYKEHLDYIRGKIGKQDYFEDKE